MAIVGHVRIFPGMRFAPSGLRLLTIRGVRGGPDPGRVGTWNSIGKVIYDQNAYGNMSEVLKALGVTTHVSKNYNTQFGITLNTRNAKKIEPAGSNRLEAETIPESSLGPSQPVLTQIQAEFDIQPGEIDMLIMDTPNIPPETPNIMWMENVSARLDNSISTVGVCHLSPMANQMNPKQDEQGYYALSVRLMANAAFAEQPHMRPQTDFDFENAVVTILQLPKHGHISADLSPGKNITYYPDAGYTQATTK